MFNAALKDGIRLKILSGTRNFRQQKSIWEAKWCGRRKVNAQDLYKTMTNGQERAKMILKYSSMPGTSRHHWGTDMDLNSVNNAYFNTSKGRRIFKWLEENAANFGFCQPYNAEGKERPYGYVEEKWHWSYSPLAQKYLKAYVRTITEKDITGFAGSQYASQLHIITHYVMGINKQCTLR